MSWGIVKVGRLNLTEFSPSASDQVNGSTGVRTVAITGEESMPPLSVEQVRQRHADIVTLPNSLVPVTFTDKTDQSGYYRVTDSGSTMVNRQGVTVESTWNITMQRLGSEHEVDLESRLSGPQSRANDFAVVGERWHAPPIGHYGYTAGTTQPSIMTRDSADGVMTVYRGLPVNVHPRWACPLASYLNGRVRFIDSNGLERSGVDFQAPVAGWELHNGLTRVRPTANGLEVSAWRSGAWRAKTWDVRVSGSSLGAIDSVTLLKNEPEVVIVRVMWLLPTQGRVTADLTLRRGSRVVEVYIEGQTSATIRVQRGETEAAITATGYITAAANDAAGNRYIIGSARTADQDVTNGAVFKAATTTLALFIGAVAGGSGASAGDTAADLYKQYIGTPAERVEGVRR